MRVNLTELSDLMGLSTNTLRDLIRQHEDFPIEQRGSNGVDYAFDDGAVATWWRAHKEKAEAEDLARRAAIAERQRELFGDPPTAEGADRPLSPQERKTAAEAALAEDKLRRTRGALLDAAGVEAQLADALTAFRQGLLQVPLRIAKAHGLDRDVRLALERAIENQVNALAHRLEQLGGADDDDHAEAA